MSGEKAIFVTGAASGIGLAVAKLFSDRGWRVGLSDVNKPGLAAAAKSHPFPLERTSTHLLEVCNRDAWREALNAFTGTSGGRLDVLFNNAGVGLGGPLAEASFEAVDRTVAVNFTGVVNGARIGYAYLQRTPGSCLLNTASASAIYGSSGLAVYSATKFAVRALTEALDGEWYPDGVRVRSLMPAFIETPILDNVGDGSNRSARDSIRAAGLEIGTVDEVAAAAWRAVHGQRLHTPVGATARRLLFAARWMPKRLRRMMRANALQAREA